MSFYTKPTFAQAVSFPFGGEYYEFQKSGAILHIHWVNNRKIVNYWLPGNDYPTHCKYCKNQDWLLDADFQNLVCSKTCPEIFTPCHICGSDCNGEDDVVYMTCFCKCF